MSTRILNAQGILSSDVPTGNLLWVDVINGVDALATRGRMTIPFKTLTAAKNAAQAGDTIAVLPGTYNEKNLLKHGVNWHFFPGAKVVYTLGENGGIFDTSGPPNGTGGAVYSIVSGAGEFSIINATGSGHVIHSAANYSSLFIEGLWMDAADTCIKIGSGVSAGQLNVKVTARIQSSGSHAILIDGSTSEHTIQTDQIVTSAGAALRVIAGGVNVVARRLYASVQPAVEIEGGTGTTIVDAREIRSSGYIGVRYGIGSGTNAILHVLNARIISGGQAAAVSIASDIAATLRVKFTCCVLVSASEYAINAAEIDTMVQFIGGSMGNVPLDGVYAIAVPAGSFTTDGNA